MNPNLKLEDQEKLRKLRVLIIEKFGSQSNFSQYSGDFEQVVSATLNGKRVLRPDQKRTWAELLDVGLDAFPDFKVKRTSTDGTVQVVEHPGGVIPVYSESETRNAVED